MAQYEDILLDKFSKYSIEELKEITVSNGYTREAEQTAKQLLGEKQIETPPVSEEVPDSETSGGNNIGGFLRVIGYFIIIFGIIGSVFLATQFQEREYKILVCVISSLGCIIGGMLFLGFSEVILLLQDIKDKL